MSAIGRTFKVELIAYLLADATVSGLIGNRLWAIRGAQGSATPYVVWSDVSGAGNYAHDGPTGLFEYRIQFNIFGDTANTIELVSDAIINRVDGYSGVLNGNVRVGYTFLDNNITFDQELDSESLRQKTIDFRFMVSAP